DILHESPIDRWFETGSIITVADAEIEEKLSPQMEYLLGSEAACCGKLVLSKLGHIKEETAEAAAERILAHINRSLEDIRCDRRFTMKDIIAKNWDSFTDDDFRLFMNAGYRGSSYVKKFSPEDIESSVHYFMHVDIPPESIKGLIDSIFGDESCGRIFRIKGSLPLEKGWLKINATREKTETAPVAEGQPVLIVIGDNVSRERIDSYLRPLNTDPEYISV
uniref:hypothetical protein n=1 Tax=Ruminococcus flavefaciens TaxID=1265 RepID=UPI0003746B8F